MTVAILAGGLASRLRPTTETIPKALIEVAGEPFLAHQLRLLRSRGIVHVVLCVGYRGEQIRDFAGSGDAFGLRIEYSFDGPVLLGTAGAIRRAIDLLPETFLVLYGDSYLPCDYAAVAEAFHQSNCPGLMTVFPNDGRWDASNVEFAGGRIVAYDKTNRTPRMRHIDYGLGAFRGDVFAGLEPERLVDLATVYQDLLHEGRLAAFEVAERFYEVGSFEGIRELEEHLRG